MGKLPVRCILCGSENAHLRIRVIIEAIDWGGVDWHEVSPVCDRCVTTFEDGLTKLKENEK